MSKFIEAADLLKRQAVKYEAFVSAAAVLDQLGSLDQVADELNRKSEAARKAAEESQARLDEINGNIEKAKEMQSQVIANTEAQANETSAAAHRDAESLIAAAKDKANSIVTDARSAAEKIVSDANAEVSAMGETRATLIADIETLTAQAKDASKSAADAQAKLESIKAQIAKLATA